MIKRVRKQFILITMSMLTAILIIPLIAVNAITENISYRQTKNLLEQIAISEVEQIEEEENAPMGTKPDNQDNGGFSDPSTNSQEQTTEVTSEETEETTETTVTTAPFEEAVVTGNVSRETKTTTQTTVKKSTVTTKTTTVKKETQTTAKTSTTKKTTATTAKTTKTTKTTTKAIVTTARTEEYTEPEYTGPYEENPPYIRPPHYWEYPEYYEDDGAYQEYDSCLDDTASMSIGAVSSHAISLLSQSSKQVDSKPPEKKGSTSVTIDHFLCFADADGLLTRFTGTDLYTEEDAQQMLDYVLESGKTDGNYGTLQYYYKAMEKGSLVVFSDRSAERLLMKKILIASLIVFFCMEALVLYLTMVLTKRAMQPMQQTFQRQREFISDAGHELKTPLTIISANVDILQDEIGDNKWLGYISSQAERMRVLITDMMNLTKLEFSDKQQEFTQFNLSNAINNAALPFESQAFELQKKFVLEVQDDVMYTGNVDQIKQLTAIFIDNAMKYSDEHGEIRVTLEQIKDKRVLKIYNTGRGVTESEKEKIFERFYRADSSRARSTGGYGLGLSIAQQIAGAHKIKINVESEYEHWICFVLNF